MDDLDPKELIADIRDAMSMDDWFKLLAESAMEHMKQVENLEITNPMALTVDDYGLLELERGYLSLYSFYTKGELPPDDTTTH